jgi:hypothetical protein
LGKRQTQIKREMKYIQQFGGWTLRAGATVSNDVKVHLKK